MKQEFPIDDEWLPLEIHPDTPPAGVRWADAFPGVNPEAFFGQLDERGRALGVRFGAQPLMSSSRIALEAGEFAKEHGRHAAYHAAVFRSFFTECRDIGRRQVILDVAAGVGLDAERLGAALDTNEYAFPLAETTLAARSRGVTGAPTFEIQGHGTIVGAMPLDAFRDALRRIAQDSSPAR